MPSPPSSSDTVTFYRDVMRILLDVEIPFLVAGSYAFEYFTDVSRHTKDFDVFIRRADLDRALDALSEVGYRTEVAFPHWLAKVYAEGDQLDLIFRSGNGVSEVDDAWFERAIPREVLGMDLLLCPPEEIIWTKAFIMERERYDGADVAHLLRSWGNRLDWQRMLHLFGPNWHVLLSHLVLFGFVYPAERDTIPEAVMQELIRRLQDELRSTPPDEQICRGTLLSRAQYLTDIERWGYVDARSLPQVRMSHRDIDAWTDAIEDENRPK